MAIIKIIFTTRCFESSHFARLFSAFLAFFCSHRLIPRFIRFERKKKWWCLLAIKSLIVSRTDRIFRKYCAVCSSDNDLNEQTATVYCSNASIFSHSSTRKKENPFIRRQNGQPFRNETMAEKKNFCRQNTTKLLASSKRVEFKSWAYLNSSSTNDWNEEKNVRIKNESGGGGDKTKSKIQLKNDEFSSECIWNESLEYFCIAAKWIFYKNTELSVVTAYCYHVW